MLIGPPETMRTTSIELAFREHPSALCLSDVNTISLDGLKDSFTSGRYSSIGFLDYQKLYERHSSTASNVEGTLRQMMEEGYTRSPHDDPTAPSTKARAFVVAAVTEAFYKRHHKAWRDSGFLRRWICSLFFMPTLSRNRMINAIHEWKKIEFDGIRRITPVTPIPYNLTQKESEYLLHVMRDQSSQATPFVLMKKIYVVLKWKYKQEPAKVRKIVEDFAPSLSKDGTQLII